MDFVVSAIILCNNLNWQYSPRCTAPVETFEVDSLGNATGRLESGIPFTQTRITPYLMHFQMENVSYLVYGNKIVYLDYAENL